MVQPDSIVDALTGLIGLALAIAAGGCAQSAADPGPSGLYDVGGGRKLFLDCQGQGSPTVFIIPGKGSYAEAWNFVVPPDDPIRSSPYVTASRASCQPRRAERAAWGGVDTVAA